MARESPGETLYSPIDSDDRAIPAGQSPPPDAASFNHSLGRNPSFSRLNAQAPEFVPRSSSRSDLHPMPPPPPPPVAVMHVFSPPPPPTSPFHLPPPQPPATFQYVCSFPEPEPVQVPADTPEPPPARPGLSDEVVQKIVNQVEYYFSDINLATTDLLMRCINKDPDGFVPMSVVASFKKIKAVVSNHSVLANALRTSSKLVVCEDGKKVRRRHPFTDADVEELQYRIIVAENLPEDHSYQNLMKIFSTVGSVKTIRTCPPQTLNGATSAASRSAKADMPFSNKLHAFVEYDSVELAEKAVAELNDERNWRSGLRVRLMLKRMAKPRGRRAGHENDWTCEDDDVSPSEQLNEKQVEDPQSSETSHEHLGDETPNEKEGVARRGGRARGRGRGRGRGQHHHNNWGDHHHNNRGDHHHSNRGGNHTVGTPPSSSPIQSDQHTLTKQPSGPRMPDGTRGFTVGRGKPLNSTTV